MNKVSLLILMSALAFGIACKNKLQLPEVPDMIKQLKFVDEKGAPIPTENEVFEKLMAYKYIKKGNRVLELGTRYGTVACVVSKILGNPDDVVSVEPDAAVYGTIESNIKQNGCPFKLFRGVIADKPLYFKAESYGSHTTGRETSGTIKVPNITLPELKKKFNITFDTYIIDCEGCYYDFIKDNRDELKNIRLVIIEFDTQEPARTKQKAEIEKIFSDYGLQHVESTMLDHINVYQRK